MDVMEPPSVIITPKAGRRGSACVELNVIGLRRLIVIGEEMLF